MKKNKLNKEGLQVMLGENREYVLPIFAITVSLLLFLGFIFPQITSFPQRKQEVDVENAKLEKIRETEKILAGVNGELLDTQIGTALKALPGDKAFEVVLNGITTAASLSNSQIENYSFQDSGTIQIETGKSRSLNFEVSIFGGISQATNFVNQIYKTFPLSNVTRILSTQSTSKISISFYYNSLPSINVDNISQIRSMTAKESQALIEISKWNDASTEVIFEGLVEESTNSAETTSPF